MKNITIWFCITLFMVSCHNKKFNKNDAIPLGVHQVIAQEAISTSVYTYVRVSESNNALWIAIPKTAIKIGGTYYYQGGMLMNKFESKELKRTFEAVLFLEGLSDDKDHLITKPGSLMKDKNGDEKHTNINADNLKKININIKTAKGGITISELFAKKDFYSGKNVKISGQVTKFSPEIMKKNWFHIQDGTENAGKFDLTITTNTKVSEGDIVTVEGKIAINKDFGYGYNYEVLMEDAVIVSPK